MSHEARDVNLRLIVAFAVSLAIFGGASHVGLVALFERFRAREERRDVAPPPLREARVEPPSPRLQENPAVDLETHRRREEQQLNTYGWVDRDRGILRIPIEQAMKLVAEGR